MLAEIYSSMLEIAKTRVPDYIEMVFHIDSEASKNFWSKENDNLYLQEREMLFEEWHIDAESNYTTKLYGVNFAIKFDNE